MSFNTEVQKPEPDTPIDLFELDLTALGDHVYYFVVATDDDGIVWKGNLYTPVDLEAEGFERSGTGPAATPKIRFSVTNQMVTGLINEYNDLIGAKIRRTRTFYKYLDGKPTSNSSAHFPVDVYRVERKTSENKVQVEFELSSILDQQGRILPGRLITSNYCPWRYRRHNGGTTGDPLLDFTYVPTDNKCPYTGNQYFDIDNNPTTAENDRCSKRVSACKLRFGKDAELPYGGFPGAARPTIG